MKNILAADIGGTNSRFAHFTLDEAGKLTLNGTRWLETRGSKSLSHLLGLLNQSEFPLPLDQSGLWGAAFLAAQKLKQKDRGVDDP